MAKTIESAASLVPARASLTKLRRAAASCLACPLGAAATQTVFGRGRAHAALLFVGEQPGDHEDLEGEPFVGPAGKVLDRALAAAGIPRAGVYLTNAVKHFSFEQRGKRRIHSKPKTSEIRACTPWLDAEIAAVKPRVVVCLGAVAALAVMGSKFKLTEMRGQVVEASSGQRVVATFHPSAALRAPDGEARARVFDAIVSDLAVARGAV